MMISRSRFTPGMKDGRDVSFDRGEVVTYRTRNGDTVEITIDSEIMRNAEAPGDGTGYESIFHDDGQRYFASRQQIIDWNGKV